MKVTIGYVPLLTPCETARKLGGELAVVRRMADQGSLSPVRTLGGHRRYAEPDVRALADRISAPQDTR